jgi:altronate dehydratase
VRPAKGGTKTLAAVYHYAEQVKSKGFVYMDTPGYDPVSATGQVAGGANILAFTTGRGSAYGCKPTPSVKLATNTPMYLKQTDDMDINCGDVLDGVTLEEKGKEIFDYAPRIASGERTKSEEMGYGDNRVRALADRRDDVGMVAAACDGPRYADVKAVVEADWDEAVEEGFEVRGTE